MLFFAGNGFSQNSVTFTSLSNTLNLNSGTEGTVDVLVNCYGNSSDPIFLNATQSCANNDGLQSQVYTNGSILTPGQNTIIRFKFKKTVTVDTQIIYKFSTNGSCFQNESQMIKITVNYKAISTGPIANNYISDNQTIYSGQVTGTIIGTNPTGGNGTFTYSWQQKIGSGSWTTITGTNGINYSPGILNTTTSYRRIATSGTTSGTSNEITITVVPPPSLQNNTIYLNGLSVLGTSPTGGLGINSYQYLWYIIDEDGDNYQLPDTSSYLSLTTPQFTGYLNSTHNFILKRIVTSGNQILASNGITLPHTTPIENNTISMNDNIVTGSLPTGGLGDYNYSWAIYYTGDAIDFDETTKDLDLTPHLNQINTILQIDSAAKLVRIVRSGVSSTSNKLSLSGVATKSLNTNYASKSAVYPNPTSDSVNFITGFYADAEIEITIFSEELGKTISVYKGTTTTTTTPNQNVKWDIPANYPKGIYFYKIISDNKEIKSGKIIFQ